MLKNVKRGIMLFVLVGILSTTTIALAQLKATAVVYAWDEAVSKFQNSNVVTAPDGTWVSFLHKLNFDDDVSPAAPAVCAAGESTKWAGVMEYGLYHVDNAPAGAPGFQATRNWQLVSCDRDGDNDFDNADLSLAPQTQITPYAGGTLTVISQDVVVPCTTGNCDTEIVTTIFINTDSDCDGTQNADIPAGGLCFYAEAQKPLPSTPSWSNPLQARISAGGGDKTVNFKLEGDVPSAVSVASFTATTLGNAALLAGAALLLAAVVVVLRLARTSRRNTA